MFKRSESKIVIDIQDLAPGVILDSLLENGGEVFKTVKQRKAILIGEAAIGKLRKKYSLFIAEDTDGIAVLRD
jgi:hypothetical protein